MVVFQDIRPLAHLHYQVIPKRHIKNVNELTVDHAELGESPCVTHLSSETGSHCCLPVMDLPPPPPPIWCGGKQCRRCWLLVS